MRTSIREDGRAARRGLFVLLVVACAASAHAGHTLDMAKRDAPGPFAFAPIVQGDPNNQDGFTDDLLSFARGGVIGGNFSEHLDTRQGSVALWWTPEFASATLNGPGDHYLWYASASYFLAYEYDNDRYNLTIGGQSLTVAAALTAGTTDSLVARWDCVNTLDGTNYLALSINDTHTFGVTTAPTPSAPGASIYVGSDGAMGGASGIIEGFTVYRRPLYDGANGINLGFGDEVNAIFAGGGLDPTRITGSWDVVLSLPTDSQGGYLRSGAGEAWSHPHRSNLIPGNTNRGGFMLSANPATDGWANEGTPTSVLALAAGETIFGGGYKVLSSGVANEGIRQDIAVAAGNDWVARAVVHSDGTCQPRIVLYDQTNLAQIGALSGTTTSTRTAPDVLLLTGEAPAGSTTLRVKLVNAAAAGTCYWHQAEVLPNLVNNPSMERWAGSNPDRPSGWSNSNVEAGQVTKETVTVHSGANAFRLNGGPDADQMRYALPFLTSGDFAAIGVMRYYNSGQAGFDAFGGPTAWFRQDSASQYFSLAIASNPGTWFHEAGVSRASGSGDPSVYVGQINVVGDFILDDFYAVSLDAIPLTATPAITAQSMENGGTEPRVDGRDALLVPGAAGVTTTAGLLSFDWRPRHSAATAVVFAETTANDAYILALSGDADDYINVYWDAANTIRMSYDMQGSTGTGTWNATGAITPLTLYTVEVAYTGGGNMTLKVGGVTRITLASIPAAFGTAPTAAYFGSNSSGANQGDATFGNLLATAVKLTSFSAVASDGAVELAWETASELDNLGFHLYRGASSGGPYQRITASLIPGLGSSPTGARYTYRDTGLENGARHFYLLEDVETSGRTERHGPVSATPQAGEGAEAEDDPPSEEASSRIVYGDPSANALHSVHRGAAGVELELVTEGFYAYPQPDGTVRLEVPGFEGLADPGLPELPVRRAWVEAIAGRNATLGPVQVQGIEGFAGLHPMGAGVPQLQVASDGTIRAGSRRARRALRRGDGLYPEHPARLLEVAFQGEVKKAFVELSPLRWDESAGRLLLARRLRVTLRFEGREAGERSLGGARGRRRPRASGADASSVRVRLATREAGLYRVTFEEALGTRRRGLRASELRLSRQGEAVAFHLEPVASRFEPGSALYFVSEGGGSNPHGNEAVYELELSTGGVVMETQSASPFGAALASAWHSREWQESRYYMAALLEAPDLWLWDRLFGGQSRAYPFELSAAAATGEPARLKLWLQGGSDLEADPDHHVSVRVNGVFVAEASWDGQRPRELEAELPAGLLVDGANALEIANLGDTAAASYSVVYLDRFAVAYPRLLVAPAGVFEGRFTGSGAASVSGLDAGVLVDTTLGAPRWLTGAASTAAGLSFRAETGRSYLAVDPRSVRRPEIRPATASALRDTSQQADYLVVGPRAFLAEAEPLLRLRRGQGLAARAVAIEDVFDAFGHGEPRPQALREFLAYAYHQWRPPSPRYVVLLGDATFDPKDLAGTGVADPVPAWMFKSRHMWTASDPTYAAVNGDDALPDLALGRLPASSVAEARAMVGKILAWESAAWGLSGPIALVADNADGAGDFEADAEQVVQTLLAGRDVERIYLSRLGGATRATIAAAFDRGASLVSYLGHGSFSLWASESIFGRNDIPGLQAQPQQPLVLTMNCLNGYFLPPLSDSLSEELVKAEGKGAIAAFSPSGLSLHDAARVYHEALIRSLTSGAHRRLGDAVLEAQAAYADTGHMPELLALYHLFGDPALTLR